mgnify:CR=1 FL=1|jgi:hypothetical protein
MEGDHCECLFTHWTYIDRQWMMAGLEGITAIVLFIFLEETNFTCDIPYVSDNPSQTDGLDRGDDIKGSKEPTVEPTTLPVPAPRMETKWPGPRPWRFGKRSPYASGIMWRGLIQPLALMASPLVFWCGVLYGIYQVYFNRRCSGVALLTPVFAFLSSGILSYPPYNFAPNSVGLTWFSPLVTCIPGALFGGWLADKYAIRMAKQNDGICEPEHKLRLFIIPAVFIPIGLLMMGLGPYYEAHWIVYVIGEGVVNLVGPLGTVLVLSYAFDSFHPIQPLDPTGVHASVQDSAPYLTCTMVIAMCVTFGFVSVHISRLAEPRVMPSPRGRSPGDSKTLQSPLRARASCSTVPPWPSTCLASVSAVSVRVSITR